MATVSQTLSEAPKRRLAVSEMWASLAIGFMWLVVLVDALFGPDLVFNDAGGNFTRIPSAIILVFFAFLGTKAVAKHGFDHPQP